MKTGVYYDSNLEIIVIVVSSDNTHTTFEIEGNELWLVFNDTIPKDALTYLGDF